MWAVSKTRGTVLEVLILEASCSLRLVRNMLAGKREILLITLRLCCQEATRHSAFREAAGRLVGSGSGDSSMYR